MKKVIFILSGLFLCSCSLFNSYQPTVAEQRTVTYVAAEYLRNIVAGDYSHVESMVAWSTYTQDPSLARSPDSVREQILSIKDRWAPEKHPLLLLQPKDLEVEENLAGIVLQKKGSDNQIWIQFVWESSGWLVSDDNIFGTNRLIASLPSIKKSSESSKSTDKK